MKKLSLLLIILISLTFSVYAEKFSFAVFGDNRDGEKVFSDMLRLMDMDNSIKFVVSTGDMTNHGTKNELTQYWNETSKAKMKFYDVMGNHDVGFFGEGTKLFKEKYGGTYYFFDYKDCRFVILDNSKRFRQDQFAWLNKVLKTKKKLFVFIHKPIKDPTGTYPKYIMTPKADADKLKDTLLRNNVRYAFSGHIHGYGREEIGNMVNILTAGGGAPLYLPHFNGGFFHYVKVTVDGDNITDEVVKIYND